MCLMVMVWVCSEASRLFFVTWLSRSLWILIVCCNLVFVVVPISLFHLAVACDVYDGVFLCCSFSHEVSWVRS